MEELKDLEQEVKDAQEVFDNDLNALVIASENYKASCARLLKETENFKMFIADKNNLAKDIN